MVSSLGVQCRRYQRWRLKNRKRTRPYQLTALCVLGASLVAAVALQGHFGRATLRHDTLDKWIGEGPHNPVAAHQLSAGPSVGKWAFEEENEGLAITLWIIIVIYMFIALAILCDDYFVASLEIISERLNLSEDVAGATFMASASSAPELFTNVADTFFGSESNIGFGTIVGSAMFNILVIIAASAIFSSGDLLVDWRPLVRDVGFYVASILMLFGFFFDGAILWWENLLMVIGYALYIAWMFKNQYLLWRLCGSPESVDVESVDVLGKVLDSAELDSASAIVSCETEMAEVPAKGIPCDSDDSSETAQKPPPLDFKAAVTAVMIAKQTLPDLEKRRLSWVADRMASLPNKPLSPSSKFRAVASAIMVSNYFGRRHMKEEDEEEEERLFTPKPVSPGIDDGDSADVKIDVGRSESVSDASPIVDKDGSVDEDDDSGISGKVLAAISAPLNFMFKYTIPDCTQEKYRDWYMITFIMSIVWIGLTSYVMVLFAEKTGDLIGISPIIMGVTVLAIGTSVPDLLGSVFVARAGNGGMAVSNAIGSNVFDILIGLGLPWFFSSAIIEPIAVCTDSLLIPIIILLLTVVIVLGVMYLAKWRLSRMVGIVLSVTYLGFVIYNVVLNNEPCEA